ncbi:hypothetical protein C2S51_027970 [Perilla frutescens var. frutescens]|nr:hypothetical protein C2S51_027970 [Perilla frutescens var. frutescens]
MKVYNSNIEKGGVDRVPQWSIEETQNFLVIRAELDPTFMETKRNKLLWEIVSARMNEIGFDRSPIQCKCKWKNLVTRYKGCETILEVEMRQWAFPFYNEMQIIFNARTERMTWRDAEGRGGGGGSAGGAASSSQKSTPAAEQFPSNDEDANERERKKKRKEKEAAITGGGSSPLVDGLKGIMEEFMNQQMVMEMQWIKAYEEREERRREREVQWRQRMEAMENERLMMLRWWREREEQRKMREEARAERRDALVAALLNKINRGENL